MPAQIGDEKEVPPAPAQLNGLLVMQPDSVTVADVAARRVIVAVREEVTPHAVGSEQRHVRRITHAVAQSDALEAGLIGRLRPTGAGTADDAGIVLPAVAPVAQPLGPPLPEPVLRKFVAGGRECVVAEAARAVGERRSRVEQSPSLRWRRSCSTEFPECTTSRRRNHCQRRCVSFQ